MLKRLIIKNSKLAQQEAKIYPSVEYTLNFDGASKGNPGLSGAGMVIYKNGNEIWSSCKFIGFKTNNQAEYSALIFGLKGALNLGIANLSVLGDSLLVINQVNNIYKVKSEGLYELYKEVQTLKIQFDYIDFNHVYREKNKRADELSNVALENVFDLSMDELGIKELDEDWCEEEKLTVCPTNNTTTISTNTSSNPSSNNNKKQTNITQFFSKNTLFPDI